MGFVKKMDFVLKDVDWSTNEDKTIDYPLSVVFDNDILEYLENAQHKGGNSWSGNPDFEGKWANGTNVIKEEYDSLAFLMSDEEFLDTVQEGISNLLGPTKTKKYNDIWKNLTIPYSSNINAVDYSFNPSDFFTKYMPNAYTVDFPLNKFTPNGGFFAYQICVKNKKNNKIVPLFKQYGKSIMDKNGNYTEYDRYDFIAKFSNNGYKENQASVQDNYPGGITTLYPYIKNSQNIVNLVYGTPGHSNNSQLAEASINRVIYEYQDFPSFIIFDKGKGKTLSSMSPFNSGVFFQAPPTRINRDYGDKSAYETEYFRLMFNVFPEECWQDDENGKGINYDYFKAENNPKHAPRLLCISIGRTPGTLLNLEDNYIFTLHSCEIKVSDVQKYLDDVKSGVLYKDFFGPQATYGGNIQQGDNKDDWSDSTGGRDSDDDDTDPNPNIPDSEPGGGNGLNNRKKDHQKKGKIKTISNKDITDTGFVTAYNPTKSELMSLASYCWSSDFADNIKKVMSDPFQAIIGLNLIPAKPSTAARKEVKLGNIATGIEMLEIDKTQKVFDMGTISLKSKDLYNNYLDYSPYAKVSIYLPFIGVKDLDVDDVMNKYINLLYKIDFATGNCVAIINVQTTADEGDNVDVDCLYQFSGNCAYQMPLTGSDMTGVIRNAINGIVSVGTGVAITAASGGALAPVAAAGIGSAIDVATSKTQIQKSGSLSGSVASLNPGRPFIILTQPEWVKAGSKGQEKYIGIPLHKTKKVEDCSGYTVYENIRVKSGSATNDEVEEIKNILTSGIIV